MKWRRTFSGPVSSDDGLLRADRLLRLYGYKKLGQMAYAAYERAEPFSWSYALRPRSLFTTLHLWTEQLQTESRYTVEVEVKTLFGFVPTLGRKLMEGELQDLQEAVLDNKLPTTNRKRQNQLAGTTQAILLSSVFVIALAAGSIGWRFHSIAGLIAYLTFLMVGVHLLNRIRLPLPFPDFPIHNPPGAKLISERKEEMIPVAPKRR